MSVIICFSFFRNIPKTVEPIPRPTKLPGKGGEAGAQIQKDTIALDQASRNATQRHNGFTYRKKELVSRWPDNFCVPNAEDCGQIRQRNPEIR